MPAKFHFSLKADLSNLPVDDLSQHTLVYGHFHILILTFEMDDTERRAIKRSRFDQTEPEPKRASRFDRRSRSPPASKKESRRSRSPLGRASNSPAPDFAKSSSGDPAAAAGKLKSSGFYN